MLVYGFDYRVHSIFLAFLNTPITHAAMVIIVAPATGPAQRGRFTRLPLDERPDIAYNVGTASSNQPSPSCWRRQWSLVLLLPKPLAGSSQ